jgi:hypothetical protein
VIKIWNRNRSGDRNRDPYELDLPISKSGTRRSLGRAGTEHPAANKSITVWCGRGNEPAAGRMSPCHATTDSTREDRMQASQWRADSTAICVTRLNVSSTLSNLKCNSSVKVTERGSSSVASKWCLTKFHKQPPVLCR